MIILIYTCILYLRIPEKSSGRPVPQQRKGIGTSTIGIPLNPSTRRISSWQMFGGKLQNNLELCRELSPLLRGDVDRQRGRAIDNYTDIH